MNVIKADPPAKVLPEQIDAGIALIKPKSFRLLHGRHAVVIPAFAECLVGNPEHGLIGPMVIQQLHFWLSQSERIVNGRIVVARTYGDWHEAFPFYTKNWLQERINGLIGIGEILRLPSSSKEPNNVYLFTMPSDRYDKENVGNLPKRIAPVKMIPLFSQLAIAFGFTEALILQQTHYGCVAYSKKKHQKDGYQWIAKTMDQWQTDEMPFLSVKTIKRAIKHLEHLGLLTSCTGMCKDPRVKSYRVEYQILAERLIAEIGNFSMGQKPDLYVSKIV